jgi:glycosyltransferase involved in cell wall biosynthesis
LGGGEVDVTGRLRVLELGAAWGLGGTEQAMEVRAGLLDPELFEVLVVGVHGGPRFERLQRRGVRTVNLAGRLERLSSVLDEFLPALVHYTRSERNCEYTRAVQKLAARAGVPSLVETNVFGRPAGWREQKAPAITGHMSLASMLRRATLAGTGMKQLFAAGHRAVYLPVPTAAGYLGATGAGEAPSREAARVALGMGPDELVACRVARPDLRKWSTRLELALPALFAAVPKLRFVLMAAPPEKARKLEQRFGRRVLCLPSTLEPAALDRVYAASDWMIHSSGIGESFGLSVAEAMHHGLPVIVDSTPEVDNAQLEVVAHAEGGLVVASSRGFVDAAKRLAVDRTLRARLAEGARHRAQTRFADRVVVAHWQRLYAVAARKGGVTPPSGLDAAMDDAEERYAAFPGWYADACGRFSGPGPDLSERATSAFLRAKDTFEYARQLGPDRVLRVLKSRLRSGSLSRD